MSLEPWRLRDISQVERWEDRRSKFLYLLHFVLFA